jgi:hypothetical protein
MNNYMNRIVKYGLLQGVTFTITLTAVSYWVNGHHFWTSLLAGAFGGLIVGVLNSLLFYRYAVPKYILDTLSIDIDPDEEIKFQTPAQYTGAKVPVSGKLFLTNKRLVFKNHKQDRNILQFSIDLQDIDKLAMFKTLGLFENGLSIHTTLSEKYIFIVDRAKQWLVQVEKVENRLHHEAWQNAG